MSTGEDADDLVDMSAEVEWVAQRERARIYREVVEPLVEALIDHQANHATECCEQKQMRCGLAESTRAALAKAREQVGEL